MKILADNALPNLRNWFKDPYKITTYTNEDELAQSINTSDVLICRSTIQVNEALLSNSRIKIVGSATSGTDHVDEVYLKQRGIAFFEARGCNAEAVADYVTATLAYLLNHKLYKVIKRASLASVKLVPA